MASNILRCANPFQMTRPPKWWLNEMHLFDPELVIFPSQQRMVFVLARRAKHSAGESLHDVKGLTQNPDTILMNRNKLVRVCEILPGVIWDQRVFKRLANHDIRRLGGPRAVADRLEAMDEKKRKTIQRDQDSEVEARARDAYKLYGYKTGSRISLANHNGRGDVKKNPVSVRVPAPIPSGIVLATR
jgi:hypothetical protein